MTEKQLEPASDLTVLASASRAANAADAMQMLEFLTSMGWTMGELL